MHLPVYFIGVEGVGMIDFLRTAWLRVFRAVLVTALYPSGVIVSSGFSVALTAAALSSFHLARPSRRYIWKCTSLVTVPEREKETVNLFKAWKHYYSNGAVAKMIFGKWHFSYRSSPNIGVTVAPIILVDVGLFCNWIL